MATLDCTNPFTGELIHSYELESFEKQKQKVDSLKKTQKKWGLLSIDKRLELVKSALQYFEVNKDEIARDISTHIGRPLHYCAGEVAGFFERANYLCDIAKTTLAPDIFTDKKGFERSIEHAPLGTIFIISAWNFPLLITVNSVVPALIAGNTVLLKHSSLTAKIGEHFEKAFRKLGDFDNLLMNSVIDHKITGEVIEQLPIDHVIFTGSVNGGRQILKHTASKFMQPALELGGKDGAYIHKDADLNYAVETVVDGCMFNSGQSCCGIERVFVHTDIYDQFLAQAKELISSYKLGDPSDSSVTMGPLAQAKGASFMLEQVKEASAEGAEILVGGNIKKIKEGTFFEPTLIANAKPSMSVMREENFGPILPVMKVNGVDEAIEMINDSDYGLTCAVFTSSIDIARSISQQANTGTVFMNRCDYLDPALPWTGVKNSGCGSSLSKYGFHSVTRRKSIHFKVKI